MFPFTAYYVLSLYVSARLVCNEWKHYEPVFNKMSYFYERTGADEIKFERAKYTESLLIPTLSELAETVFWYVLYTCCHYIYCQCNAYY